MIKNMFLRRRKGFTLIELLIVVAIIGVLAGIAIPNFLSARTKAKVSRSFADMRNVANGLEMAYLDTATYPADPSLVINAISGYVSSIASDPFNTGGGRAASAAEHDCGAIDTNSYGYDCSGDTCWLLLGNGPDDNQDISAIAPVGWAKTHRIAGNIGGDETTLAPDGNPAYNLAAASWATSTTASDGDIARGGP